MHFFSLCIQLGVTIINRNLLGDKFLATEKLRIVMLGTDKLKTNHGRSIGLLHVPRLHNQFVPVRRRMSDPGLEIAHVQF